VSLDCISKLLSYNVLVENDVVVNTGLDDSQVDLTKLEGGDGSTQKASDTKPLVDIAIDLVCDCNIGENTDPRVHLQVIKALVAALASPNIPLHGSGLLKAIRTTWNIFLVSKSSQIQTVAQGSLTQMISTVFARACQAIQDESHPNMNPGSGSIDGNGRFIICISKRFVCV
jgi:brefeldin A-inhibited guanine nucleotide-exchange protein